MFKLKKILNKHNNAPEIEILDMEQATIGAMERIYYLTNAKLAFYSNDSERPTFYVGLRVLDDYSSERRMECYRITPDMIFEVKHTTTTRAGDKFKLISTTESEGFSQITTFDVTSSEENHGYVVDASNQKTTGKILIRFHCYQ